VLYANCDLWVSEQVYIYLKLIEHSTKYNDLATHKLELLILFKLTHDWLILLKGKNDSQTR